MEHIKYFVILFFIFKGKKRQTFLNCSWKMGKQIKGLKNKYALSLDKFLLGLFIQNQFHLMKIWLNENACNKIRNTLEGQVIAHLVQFVILTLSSCQYSHSKCFRKENIQFCIRNYFLQKTVTISTSKISLQKFVDKILILTFYGSSQLSYVVWKF